MRQLVQDRTSRTVICSLKTLNRATRDLARVDCPSGMNLEGAFKVDGTDCVANLGDIDAVQPHPGEIANQFQNLPLPPKFGDRNPDAIEIATANPPQQPPDLPQPNSGLPVELAAVNAQAVPVPVLKPLDQQPVVELPPLILLETKPIQQQQQAFVPKPDQQQTAVAKVHPQPEAPELIMDCQNFVSGLGNDSLLLHLAMEPMHRLFWHYMQARDGTLVEYLLRPNVMVQLVNTFLAGSMFCSVLFSRFTLSPPFGLICSTNPYGRQASFVSYSHV